MQLHPNARITPSGRALLVARVRQDRWTVAQSAEAAGISLRTAYKWLARYRDEGLEGLQDRSSRPERCPSRTLTVLRRKIERLRQRRLVAWEIAERLSMALSTVSRILKQLGLGRLWRLEPKEPERRYEWNAPGEMLHVDTKKLARIRRIGHRIHGDRSRIAVGAGWEFAHVCVDDHTRLAYVEVLADEKGHTASGFFKRAVAWFQRKGISTQRVLTDNGSCYTAKVFQEQCRQLGVRHLFTKPYTPRTNGKAERFIQTMTRRWAYKRPYRSSAVRTAALPDFVWHYNHRRPHRSIGKRPPIERLRETHEQRH